LKDRLRSRYIEKGEIAIERFDVYLAGDGRVPEQRLDLRREQQTGGAGVGR
jgi:hypothetical protein